MTVADHVHARRLRRLAVIGGVGVGGTAPIVVQSMTNTDTEDVFTTSMQVAQLARAGSELVRITVNTREAAAAVPKIRERLAQMNVEVPPDTSLYGDPTAARQILSNLAENALRHTMTGEVVLFAEPHDDGTWIGVRDTGVGMEAEHLPRIFERFYRADPGRSREAGGTGLGLAIVRHLAEAHGGRVRAESTPGVGTTIAALFPSGREDSPA